MKKKIIIDIYTVMQVHKKYRSFCYVFTSFEDANAKFEELLKYFKEVKKVKPEEWITNSIPSQIKVSIIKNIILYLCKETKEIEIEIKEDFTKTIDNSTSNLRCFYNKKECIEEMLKFSPFGILYDKINKRYITVLEVCDDGITILSNDNKIITVSYFSAKAYFTFLDNNPFGICEKQNF